MIRAFGHNYRHPMALVGYKVYLRGQKILRATVLFTAAPSGLVWNALPFHLVAPRQREKQETPLVSRSGFVQKLCIMHHAWLLQLL